MYASIHVMCMYICVHIYIYIYTHIHIYIYIHTYIHTYIYIYIYTYIRIHVNKGNPIAPLQRQEAPPPRPGAVYSQGNTLHNQGYFIRYLNHYYVCVYIYIYIYIYLCSYSEGLSTKQKKYLIINDVVYFNAV